MLGPDDEELSADAGDAPDLEAERLLTPAEKLYKKRPNRLISITQAGSKPASKRRTYQSSPDVTGPLGFPKEAKEGSTRAKVRPQKMI